MDVRGRVIVGPKEELETVFAQDGGLTAFFMRPSDSFRKKLRAWSVPNIPRGRTTACIRKLSNLLILANTPALIFMFVLSDVLAQNRRA